MGQLNCDGCGNCMPRHVHSVCVVHLNYIFPNQKTCEFFVEKNISARGMIAKNRLLWLLVVLALLLPSLSFSASFQVKDTCYPDHLTALDSWASQFPTEPDSNGVMWFLSSATIDPVTGNIVGGLRNSADNKIKAITGITLAPCNAQSAARVFDKFSMQDMVLPMALVVVFVMGFGQGKSSL